jgi:hypothetical protein
MMGEQPTVLVANITEPETYRVLNENASGSGVLGLLSWFFPI